MTSIARALPVFGDSGRRLGQPQPPIGPIPEPIQRLVEDRFGALRRLGRVACVAPFGRGAPGSGDARTSSCAQSRASASALRRIGRVAVVGREGMTRTAWQGSSSRLSATAGPRQAEDAANHPRGDALPHAGPGARGPHDRDEPINVVAIVKNFKRSRFTAPLRHRGLEGFDRSQASVRNAFSYARSRYAA